jgi:hypothetical protein
MPAPRLSRMPRCASHDPRAFRARSSEMFPWQVANPLASHAQPLDLAARRDYGSTEAYPITLDERRLPTPQSHSHLAVNWTAVDP